MHYIAHCWCKFPPHWDGDIISIMATILQTKLSNTFLERKHMYFAWYFIDVCAKGSIQKHSSIASDDGLAPTRWHITAVQGPFLTIAEQCHSQWEKTISSYRLRPVSATEVLTLNLSTSSGARVLLLCYDTWYFACSYSTGRGNDLKYNQHRSSFCCHV